MNRFAILALALGLLLPAAAQPETPVRDGITVSGFGLVTAKPDVAFITLYVKGNGVLPSNAVEECKTKTEKVLAALKKKHPRITNVEVRAFALGNSLAQAFSPAQAATVSPEAVKRIVITAPPEPKKLHAILDTAVQSGALIASPNPFYRPSGVQNAIVYGLRNASDASSRAMKAAVNDARSQATAIARQFRRKVGKAVGVATKESVGIFDLAAAYGDLNKHAYHPVKFFSASSDEVRVESRLVVRFELASQ